MRIRVMCQVTDSLKRYEVYLPWKITEVVTSFVYRVEFLLVSSHLRCPGSILKVPLYVWGFRCFPGIGPKKPSKLAV